MKLIAAYIKSISVEEDGKRLAALHDVVQDIMEGQTLDDSETRKRVDKDIYHRKEVK